MIDKPVVKRINARPSGGNHWSELRDTSIVGSMPTLPSERDSSPIDSSSPRELVTTRLRPADVARLDQSAARRGIGRDEMVAEAIDAFLAREIWSGGFIAPPPPMEIPGPYPWRRGAVRLFRRK